MYPRTNDNAGVGGGSRADEVSHPTTTHTMQLFTSLFVELSLLSLRLLRMLFILGSLHASDALSRLAVSSYSYRAAKLSILALFSTHSQPVHVVYIHSTGKNYLKLEKLKR